jgi:hypothetical protein
MPYHIIRRNENMKDKIVMKGLIIGVICVLMLPSIVVASTESNSSYNLTVKIKNTKFYKNSATNVVLSVNVSNEGPDSCNNYSCNIKIYSIFTHTTFVNQIKLWFIPWFTGISYNGSAIAPSGYEKKLVTISNPGTGLWIARCTISSPGDNNKKDNKSHCLIWVPELFILHKLFPKVFPR